MVGEPLVWVRVVRSWIGSVSELVSGVLMARAEASGGCSRGNQVGWLWWFGFGTWVAV